MTECANPKEARVTGALMYYGRHESNAKYIFVRVDGIPNDGRELPHLNDLKAFTFEFEIIQFARPGEVFEFDFSEDGRSVYFFDRKPGKRTARYAYKQLPGWKNSAQVARWRAEHAAREAERDARRAYESERSKWRTDLEALADLRAVYQRLPSPVKAQLLAQVVNYLTR